MENITELSYEIFVIDNNSSRKGFDKIVNKYNRNDNFVFLKNKENEGGAVVNKFLERLNGKYIIHIQSDVGIKKGSILKLFEFLEKNKDAGAASARLLNPDVTYQKYYFKMWNIPMAFF